LGIALTLTYVDRDELRISPAVEWSPDERISLGLSYDHNFFLKDSLDLYYKPNSFLNFTGKEDFFDGKLRLTQDFRLVGPREHYDYSVAMPFDVETFVTLPSYLDLGLGARYRINESFDIYVKGLNLLQSGGEVWTDSVDGTYAANWLQYPIPGRQVWGGLKFRI